MATNFPAGLDTFTNPTSSDTLASPNHADQHANANDAIEAIETTLGTNPQGASASVSARIAALESAPSGGAVLSVATFISTATQVLSPDIFQFPEVYPSSATWAYTEGVSVAAGGKLVAHYDAVVSIISADGATGGPLIDVVLAIYDTGSAAFVPVSTQRTKVKNINASGAQPIREVSRTYGMTVATTGTYASYLVAVVTSAASSTNTYFAFEDIGGYALVGV